MKNLKNVHITNEYTCIFYSLKRLLESTIRKCFGNCKDTTLANEMISVDEEPDELTQAISNIGKTSLNRLTKYSYQPLFVQKIEIQIFLTA